MDRRAFPRTVAGSLLAEPFVAGAQPAGKIAIHRTVISGSSGVRIRLPARGTGQGEIMRDRP